MAEQIRVNGPNGLVVNFPAGTSPETINRVMQEAAGGRPQGQPAPQMSQLDAAAQAARAGFQANFNDELAGLRAAGVAGMPGFVRSAVEKVPALSAVVAPNVGAARMAAERLFPQTFGSRATEAYAPARDVERAIDRAAEEQFPNTYLGANIAGSVAAPLGFVGRGAGAAITAGGASGAASGFGRGEGTQERLLGGAMEGALGAGFGAIPGLAMGAFNAGQRVLAPQKFAERVVRRTIEADRARGVEDVLTPADIAAARAAGQDIVVGDLGATGTLRLSRAAGNVSEDASARLRGATDPRYTEQKGRFGDFIEGLFGGDLNLTSANDVLRDTARRVNAPLYRAAYQAGEGADLWNPTLSRIAQAPSVQAAIRDVEKKAADRAVLEGDLVIRNPFSFDDQGRMVWGTTPDGGQIRPNLQFWDQVQRNLREASEAAPRGSSAERDLKALRDRLNQELDSAVPEFGRARGMARQFFGAEDALEAGQTFFRQNRSIQLTDTQKAFRSMSVPERELFRRGFAAELANAVRNSRDSQDVAKLFDGANRRKLEVVMPTDELRQLEAFVRREAIMNRLRSATQGNSTTAQQLRDMSIGAGAGMGVGTFASGDPFTGAGTALLGGLLARGRIRVNENVMREVGEILSSSDPDRINKLLTGPNGNVIMNTLRKMSQAVGAGASNQPSTPPVRLTLNAPPPPSLPPPGPPDPTGFARGGQVKEPKMSPIVEAIIEEMGKRMAPEGARRAAAAAGYSRGGAVRKVASAIAERLLPETAETPAQGGLAAAREPAAAAAPLTRRGSDLIARDPRLTGDKLELSERGDLLPNVEYRYTRKDDLAPWRELTPEDLYRERAYIAPALGDRSPGNMIIDEINGMRLARPVDTQGGGDFQRANLDAAWANREAAAKNLMNKIAGQTSDDAPVYMSHTLMGLDSVDSSHMMAQALLRQISTNKGNIDKAAAEKVDGFISRHIKNWPGILNTEAVEQFLMREKTPGTYSSILAKALDKAGPRKGGFPDVGAARFAVTDPRLLSADQLASGYTFSRLNPRGALFRKERPHETYPVNLPSAGEGYAGGFRNQVPAEVMFSDWARGMKAVDKNNNPLTPTMKQQALMTQVPVQRANQEWLDTVMSYIEANPRKWGYRKGGLARSRAASR